MLAGKNPSFSKQVKWLMSIERTWNPRLIQIKAERKELRYETSFYNSQCNIEIKPRKLVAAPSPTQPANNSKKTVDCGFPCKGDKPKTEQDAINAIAKSQDLGDANP